MNKYNLYNTIYCLCGTRNTSPVFLSKQAMYKISKRCDEKPQLVACYLIGLTKIWSTHRSDLQQRGARTL